MKTKKKTYKREICIGKCYVFFRENHEWHSGVVVVLGATSRGRFKVARACSVCEAFMSGRQLQNMRVKTWTAEEDELG